MVGGWVASDLLHIADVTGVNSTSIAVATIGAVIVILVVGSFNRRGRYGCGDSALSRLATEVITGEQREDRFPAEPVLFPCREPSKRDRSYAVLIADLNNQR